MFLFLTSFTLMVAIPCVPSLPPIIKIGAIFSEAEKGGSSELAFRYAVHRINRDKYLLPHTQLVYDIQYVPLDDSFHASKKACQQVQFGVQAMFGPSDPMLGPHIHSVCDALDIPHIEARLDLDPDYKEFSINLYPSPRVLNSAYQDIIRFLNWTKLAIVYENDYGLIKLRDLDRTPSNKDLEIHLMQADPNTYRDTLQTIKTKEIQNLIVDTRPENINEFLKGILQLQMNDYKFHYLFTSFDIESFDLEDFKYNFVNMTAFRLVDASDITIREILKDMDRFRNGGKSSHNTSLVISSDAALMYDSVYVFAVGLQTLEQSHSLQLTNLSCEDETPWDAGLSLINYVNSVEIKGLTGPIEFKEGKRVDFKMDVLKLKQHSLAKVGEWETGAGVNISDPGAFFDSSTMNVTLLVVTILERPYVMHRLSSVNLTGNARYEGFCIDLLRAIAGMVGFEYSIQLVPDGKYGVFDYESGEWNGIVRQLMDKKADLAVGSMTINYARESVIDFTKPFMNLGISILFKVPTSQSTRLFSFMNPLAIEIWLYVLAAYILVSLTMFLVARFSPYEWHNPHPCDVDNDLVQNQFSMSNSFWFTIGTLMQQGSLNPKATSTRIVGGIWWFFTLIIISSYTANLAAFLTVERMITPIENAQDLSEQTEIMYGTLSGGSTQTFFRDSKIEIYQKMWRYMESKRPSVFVPDYEEGVKRVLEGDYAFLMESTMLDYEVQRNCNLTQIGGLLDSKGYGIATPIGSPWRDKISLAILELQEKGEIQMMYNKWWKHNRGDLMDHCNRNDKTNKESKANALDVDNIGGVFVVLLCGLAVAIMVAIVEFCYNSKKASRAECSSPNPQAQSLCLEMTDELCFAIKCRGSRQKPALRRKCSNCHSIREARAIAQPRESICNIPPPPAPLYRNVMQHYLNNSPEEFNLDTT
uniref:Glutamate receptor ionotropic, kainate 2 n=1 Tax=Cacopsylla melanoneura TaxID=428564 RepID=A0A8D8YFR0_9HEMI